ncbi:MAG: type IX secretion system outer membrane channel protein PorV [Bacteroidales bacterium]
MSKNWHRLFVFYVWAWAAVPLNAQITPRETGGSNINTIQSVVPFLTIAPDSRSGGMGDVGAATSPDVYSMHWNPAKYAFIEGSSGLAISYSPWLRKLVPDISLAYLSGYTRIDRLQVISYSLLYFSLGDITFTDEWATPIRDFTPNEFAFDLGYSRKFTDYLSGGMAFRFIYSNLTGGYSNTKPGTSFAGDISLYYRRDAEISGKNAHWALGANISNIGTKMSYTEEQEADFIPINLRIGGALTLDMDAYNSLTLAADINKLLVPTPPIYNGNDSILYGKDPNVSVPVGMIQSFYDAPGRYAEDGTTLVSPFQEELRELMFSVGMEYWYARQFAVRAGYFHEHETKGNRKFFSMGMGLQLNVFSLDFSYLIPVKQNHPLAGTLRFSLGFDFDTIRRTNNGS